MDWKQRSGWAQSRGRGGREAGVGVEEKQGYGSTVSRDRGRRYARIGVDGTQGSEAPDGSRV